MSHRELVVAASKCIIITLCWILVYVALPYIVKDREGSISRLLHCNKDFDVVLLCVAAFVNWFIIGLCYMFVDYYYELHGLLNLKRIQYPNRNGLEKINWELVNTAIHLSAMNTITTIVGVIFIFAPLAKLRGVCDYDNVYNYSLIWNIPKLPFILISTDFIFYSTHRIFHSVKWLYQNVHKIHHQFVDTYCLSANACHPVEHIVTNLSSVLLPLIILNIPLFWAVFWLQIATLNSTFCHSGYVFFQKISPIPHDFHHHFLNIEFGAGTYFDSLFGTNLKCTYPAKYPIIMEPYVNKKSK